MSQNREETRTKQLRRQFDLEVKMYPRTKGPQPYLHGCTSAYHNDPESWERGAIHASRYPDVTNAADTFESRQDLTPRQKIAIRTGKEISDKVEEERHTLHTKSSPFRSFGSLFMMRYLIVNYEQQCKKFISYAQEL